MAHDDATAPRPRWTVPRALIMLVAAVAFVGSMALYVTSPPRGYVSIFGFVVPVVAGAYLLFIVYNYATRSPVGE